MNIYKVYRDDKELINEWDVYEGAVIVVENEQHAREIARDKLYNCDDSYFLKNYLDPTKVKVEQVNGLIPGVVLSSFKAG